MPAGRTAPLSAAGPPPTPPRPGVRRGGARNRPGPRALPPTPSISVSVPAADTGGRRPPRGHVSRPRSRCLRRPPRAATWPSPGRSSASRPVTLRSPPRRPRRPPPAPTARHPSARPPSLLPRPPLSALHQGPAPRGAPLPRTPCPTPTPLRGQVAPRPPPGLPFALSDPSSVPRRPPPSAHPTAHRTVRPKPGAPRPRADSPRPCDAGRDRSTSGTNALSGHLSGGARGGRLGTFRSRRGAGPRCGREGAGGAASASGPRDVGSRWSWVAAPLPPQPPPGDGARLPRCQGLPLTTQQEVDTAGGLQGFPGVGPPGVSPVPLACSLRAARLEQSQHNSCRGHRQEPTPTAPPAPCPGLPERERAPGPSRGVLVWIQSRGRSASGSLTPSAHGDTAKDSPMPAPSIFSKRPNKPCLPAGLLGTALRQGPGHGGQTAQQSQRTRGGLTDGPLFTALPPPQTWAYPLALPYLAPMQALFPAVSMGGGGRCVCDTNGWPHNHKERHETGTRLSIYCSANRGCWGLHPPLPSSHPPPAGLLQAFPGLSHLRTLHLVLGSGVALSGTSFPPQHFVPSPGRGCSAVLAPAPHTSCPPFSLPSFGNSGEPGILASGSLLS